MKILQYFSLVSWVLLSAINVTATAAQASVPLKITDRTKVVMVGPELPKGVYRTYTLSKSQIRGLFQVFVDAGRKGDGARAMVFFPRRAEPRAEALPNGDVALTLVTGQRLVISHATGNVASIEGMKFKESSQAALEADGFQITQVQNAIILDGGWRQGVSPFDRSKNSPRSSVFRDGKGNSCKVDNTEILSWSSIGDPIFKLQTDEEAIAFLKKRCPSIDLSAFRAGVRVSEPSKKSSDLESCPKDPPAPGPDGDAAEQFRKALEKVRERVERAK